MTILRKYSDILELSPHNEWSQKFWDQLVPFKNKISQHPFFTEMAKGQLSLVAFRYALIHFYPLVAQFPAYMSLALAKAVHFNEAGVVETRDWLIQNIKVEQRHLVWYQDWAQGFGISEQKLQQIRPNAAMNAINHYLWNLNMRGSLAESLAATNLAIEWATGEWTLKVYEGIEHYTRFPEVELNKRSLAWLRAHAHYDDLHPYEAMELIKRLCQNDSIAQDRALEAAKIGFEYYELALDECYKIQSLS